MSAKKCYCRYDNGTFLYTCFEPKGHTGIHHDSSSVDGKVEWTEEQGWYDQCGDSPEKAVKRQ